jgi:hypothetical protein
MQNRPLALQVADPDPVDLDDYAAYDDGGTLVLCDRTNPRAWIRVGTAATTTLDP